MAVLIIFPVILQTVINLIMLFIGGQAADNAMVASYETTSIRCWIYEL